MMFYSVSKGQGGRGCTQNIGPDFVGPIHCGAYGLTHSDLVMRMSALNIDKGSRCVLR